MGGKSKERAHMPPSQRAKQFLPFEAVAGLREALKIKEHEMGLISREELSEEVGEYINETLQEMNTGDHVSIRYFRDAEGFDGEGDMVMISGIVRGVDPISQTVTVEPDDAAKDLHGFTERTAVRIQDITSIDIDEPAQ